MSEPEPAYGTVEMACDHLAQTAGGVIAHATILQSYADLRFFPGIEFSARVTLAYLRALVGALEEVERSRAVIAYRRSAEAIGPGQGL